MKWELITSELGINYESYVNMHMNKLHSSSESDVCNNHCHKCFKSIHARP
jgi:hypothetical protein